eukprot:GHVQ01027433.1.p1 GENE.GHVQ01027433.1~~GHVQ01027433.1.p1  ORF type:complete len:363 (+),score=40.24 GHVQ01027433.1:52-1089(+)
MAGSHLETSVVGQPPHQTQCYVERQIANWSATLYGYAMMLSLSVLLSLSVQHTNYWTCLTMADGAAIQHNSQQSLHGLISPGRISHITRAHMRPSSLQRDIIPRNIIRSADRRTSRHHNSTNCNVPLNIGGGAIDRVHRMPCMIQPVGRLYSSTDVSQVTGGSGVGVSVVEGGGGNGGGQVPPVSCRGGVMGSQGIGRVGSNIVFEWVEKRPVSKYFIDYFICSFMMYSKACTMGCCLIMCIELGIADICFYAAMSVLGGLALVGYLGRQLLEVPFRTYHGASSVADAYDRWTEEAIVEHYWGDHVHLGYYTDEQRSQGAFRQDYKKVLPPSFCLCFDMNPSGTI